MALTNKKLSVVAGGLNQKTATDGSVQVDDFSLSAAFTVPSAATKMFHNRYTIAGSGSQSLDLSGALTDQLGQAFVLTKIYGLLIKLNTSTTGAKIEVGGGSNCLSTIFADVSDKIVVKNGGSLSLCGGDGYAVTASTADILTIANPGGSNVEVDVFILGE